MPLHLAGPPLGEPDDRDKPDGTGKKRYGFLIQLSVLIIIEDDNEPEPLFTTEWFQPFRRARDRRLIGRLIRLMESLFRNDREG